MTASPMVQAFGLARTLAILYAAAERTGKEHGVNLEGGLRIVIRVTPKKTALMLKRNGDRFPSMVEWRTVIERWPCEFPKLEPEEMIGQGWRALWARWETKAVKVCTR